MEQRDFKGIWIPKEIWLDTRLNALEKIILAEIDSLDCEETGCYASNDYLAEFCQCSITKVSLAIKKLLDFEYIYIVSFDGRTRFLKSRLSKNERQSLTNSKDNNINNNINDNFNIDNKNNNTNNKPNINNNKENKKENFDEIFDYWNGAGICHHREKTPLMLKAYNKAIKDYGLNNNQIKIAIDHYKTMINDRNCWLKQKWSLAQFLKQENACVNLTDEGSFWVNYNSPKIVKQGLVNAEIVRPRRNDNDII